MKTIRFLLFLVGVSLLAISAVARLGETEAQVIERYGKVIMRTPDSVIEQGKILKLGDRLHFRQDDWNIIAVMIDDRCENITYLKPGEWTEEQFRYILESNGGREKWEEQKTTMPNLERKWKRRDKTNAVWRPIGGITLIAPGYEQARQALAKHAKEEASKLPKL